MMRVYDISVNLTTGETINNFFKQHAECRDDVIEYLNSLKAQDKVVGTINTHDIQSFEINYEEHNSYLPSNQAEQQAIENCDCLYCRAKDPNTKLTKPDGSDVTIMDYISELEQIIKEQNGVIDLLENDLQEVSNGSKKKECKSEKCSCEETKQGKQGKKGKGKSKAKR